MWPLQLNAIFYRYIESSISTGDCREAWFRRVMDALRETEKTGSADSATALTTPEVWSPMSCNLYRVPRLFHRLTNGDVLTIVETIINYTTGNQLKQVLLIHVIDNAIRLSDLTRLVNRPVFGGSVPRFTRRPAKSWKCPAICANAEQNGTP